MLIYLWPQIIKNIERWRSLLRELEKMDEEDEAEKAYRQTLFVDLMPELSVTLNDLSGRRDEVCTEIARLSQELASAAEERNVDSSPLHSMVRYWTANAREVAAVVIDRLHTIAINENNQELAGKPAKTPNKRGRRKGSLKSDPRQDAEVYKRFKESYFSRSIADFVRHAGLDFEETKAAIKRHRMRHPRGN